jgi:hypothetical protein
MTVPSREDLLEMVSIQKRPCLAIYLCTDRLGADTQQNPIRLKNLLREAEDRLVSAGMRAVEGRDMLAPAYGLLSDSPFWRHMSDGLALFLAPGFFRSHRVPLNVDELIVVNDRFYIKPLLPLLVGDGRFYLLALSQGGVRLFNGTRDGLTPIELRNVPANLRESMHTDEPSGSLQFHTLAQPTGGPGSERAGMYFGNDIADNNFKRNIVQYFHEVDRGVREAVQDEEVPLLLAGVEYLIPLYREANSYQNLLATELSTGVEAMSAEQLHAKAWPLVEPIFMASRQKALELYRQLNGEASPRASDSLREVVPAAFYGRVDTLLVDGSAQEWGQFDPATGSIAQPAGAQNGAEDLLDLAALWTLKNSGPVYTVAPGDLPAPAPVAAIFRY